MRRISPPKHILFVNAGYPNKKRSLVTAKENGMFTSVVGPELPDWARPFVDQHIVANTYDLDQTIEALGPRHARRPFDGVVTFWDRDVEIVAGVAAAFGLPGTPLAAARAVRNKYWCRKVLHEHGVPEPRYAHFGTWEDMQRGAELIGYPLICKPLGAAASKGVLKVASPDELPGAYELLVTTVRPEFDRLFSYHPGQYVMEEFMDGREFSVEGIVRHRSVTVIGVTEKWTDEFFVEYQHAFPARVSSPEARRISETAIAAVEALGLDNCGFHVEVMVGRQGPKIVEVNGRLGGDLITSHLVPLALQVDLVRAALLTAVGEEATLEPRAHRGACIRYLLAKRDGKVAEWRGAASVPSRPGVSEFALEKGLGDRVILPPSPRADRRVCYVVASGQDTNAAIRNAEVALGDVTCVVA